MLLSSPTSLPSMETLSYAVGILAALLGIAPTVRKIRPALRARVLRWDRLDQLLGDPDASPPRQGVLEQVAALRDEVADMRGGQRDTHRLAEQLVPNSGSSWRDAYERDQAHQQQISEAIAEALGIELPPLPPRTMHHPHD